MAPGARGWVRRDRRDRRRTLRGRLEPGRLPAEHPPDREHRGPDRGHAGDHRRGRPGRRHGLGLRDEWPVPGRDPGHDHERGRRDRLAPGEPGDRPRPGLPLRDLPELREDPEPLRGGPLHGPGVRPVPGPPGEAGDRRRWIPGRPGGDELDPVPVAEGLPGRGPRGPVERGPERLRTDRAPEAGPEGLHVRRSDPRRRWPGLVA